MVSVLLNTPGCSRNVIRWFDLQKLRVSFSHLVPTVP